jgi:LytS/YehU family sensor histidine kinase
VTSLGREIDLIEAYLDIERARFEQRLRVTIDVPARLRHIHIPSLLIQPLVENAVKHGIAPLAAGGEVLIHADTHTAGGERQLVIVIRDSGVGAAAEALERGRERGVGLRNIERRLRAQYGAAASLSVQSTPSQGTTAEVRIPILRTIPAAPPADRIAV